MKVGIDNYSLLPLKPDPLDTLKWAAANGAEGVQFSGLEPEHDRMVDRSYLQEVRAFAAENSLYLEWGGGQHIPMDTITGEPVDLTAVNSKAAAAAAELGTCVIRSCSGGLMRWKKEGASTQEFLSAMAPALRKLKPMLRDFRVILALETHFEFTTFELLRLFDACDAAPGEYLGICLDTMNLLTMLEDPVSAVRRILPWVVSTHIKDGGLLWSGTGLVSFPAEIGQGVIDLPEIIRLLDNPSRPVNLSIEDHGGSFELPVFNPSFLEEFPDLDLGEFVKLAELASRTQAAVEQGELHIESRSRWPAVCEDRIKRDILALKDIRKQVFARTPD